MTKRNSPNPFSSLFKLIYQATKISWNEHLYLDHPIKITNFFVYSAKIVMVTFQL